MQSSDAVTGAGRGTGGVVAAGRPCGVAVVASGSVPKESNLMEKRGTVGESDHTHTHTWATGEALIRGVGGRTGDGAVIC